MKNPGKSSVLGNKLGSFILRHESGRFLTSKRNGLEPNLSAIFTEVLNLLHGVKLQEGTKSFIGWEEKYPVIIQAFPLIP